MSVFMRRSLVLFISLFAINSANAMQEIELIIRDVIKRSAILHEVNGNTGAVLAHQSGRDAASWSNFARGLGENNIESLALESVAMEDIQSGVEYLRSRGKSQIILIGSSIGGAAIQNSLQSGQLVGVSHMVLLGTGRGNTSDVAGIKKLFVVTEQDFFSRQTYSSFEKAKAPKTLMVLPGTAHGQEMLETKFGEGLTEDIISFIRD